MIDPTTRRERTQYPALRLWFACLDANVHGQDPRRPSTWTDDGVFHAANLEARAILYTETGAEEEAMLQLRRARSALEPGIELLERTYRFALFQIAVERLGQDAASRLALKERPRRNPLRAE